ncbi:MAG: SMC-Scp complex subunit ScpB [Gammaproteobacteria bacterium RIFCSPHIGHO2_12_FULL_38_14]|nr:MAG: SMC-Scp complex subunit ScpB [Gammaproteobacteria bacterium RIFCSPHIGHO2_12_FULL_38_14]
MTTLTDQKKQAIVEAALLVAGEPQTINALQNLFDEYERPSAAEIKSILAAIETRHEESGIELQEVASGYRLQARASFSTWLSKLWEARSPRYSRAFLETLAIIAYKQPITRAEIEDIRGVVVNSQIIHSLLEREWIRVLGHREVPGRPALLGTTKTFLDYFNLKSLSDLPPLTEFKDFESQDKALQVELQLASEKESLEQTDETQEVA